MMSRFPGSAVQIGEVKEGDGPNQLPEVVAPEAMTGHADFLLDAIDPLLPIRLTVRAENRSRLSRGQSVSETEGTLQITEYEHSLGYKPDIREFMTPIFGRGLSMVAGLRRMMSWEWVPGDSYATAESDASENTELF